MLFQSPGFALTVLRFLFKTVGMFFLLLMLSVIFLVVDDCMGGQDPPHHISKTSNAPKENETGAKEQSELSLFEDIPVVVTASRQLEHLTEAPSIISVITEDDIQRMGARNLMDVLRTIPGMEIMKDARDVSQIAVRGLRSENSTGVKILVDGHALNDPITGGATELYDDLPLKNIRRIEIIRGPASAVYGANAFVSVVNIITKNAREINGTEVSLGAGSFRTFNPSILFGKTVNELEISLYADYYTTAGPKLWINADTMSLYDEEAVPQGFPPISLSPGNFQDQREKLHLAYKLKYLDFTLHGGFLEKSWGPFLTDWYVLNDHSTENVRHIYSDLEYRHFFTERLEFNGKIYTDYFRGRINEQVAPGIALDTPADDAEIFVYPNGLISKYRAKSWRVGGEDQLKYRLFKDNDLTIGVAYEYLSVENFQIRTNQYNYIRGYPPDELHDLADLVPDVQTSSSQTFAAIFVQDKWKIGRYVDLTLGVRGDYFNEFGGVFTPKVGITYAPRSDFNIKALFGTAFRIPSFLESFMTRSSQGSPAREDLVVEELRTAEIGVSYRLSNWLVGEINCFNSDINELTETTEGQDTGIYPGTTRTYQNIGGIDVRGVEVEFRGKSEKEINLGIIPRLIGSSFRINYSYQDAQDSTTHAKVPNMARHKGNLGIGFNLSAENLKGGERNPWGIFRSFSDEFSLYFNLFLCGERQRSRDDVREALPGFAILDMTLTAYDVFHKGLGLSFSMKNMFDQRYSDPSSEFAPQGKYSTALNDFPNPGRSFFLELQYTF